MRDLAGRVLDFVTVADARRIATAPSARQMIERVAAPRGRALMTFDDGTYKPVDQMIAEMWRGTGRATQQEALAVPGVLRARNLICGVATWPLADLDRNNRRTRNPLLEQFDPNVPNSVFRAQVVQDLLFEGLSWVRVIATDTTGYPVHMEHLDFHRVSFSPADNADGMSPLPSGYTPRERGQLVQIYVDGEPADHRYIKRFDSPNPGVLTAAGDTIKLAATYRRTAIMYAKNPRMDGYLYPKEGADPLDDDDAVQSMLDDFEDARQRHSVGYVPAALGYESVDALSPADLQLVQLHEQATREVALALGLEPADLGVSSVTETYSNRIDKRIDRINDLLSAYVTAFDERMSMGDITRNGHRVWSDPNAFLRANPTERIAYYQGMVQLGAFDQDDVSDAENVPRKPKQAVSRPAGSNVVPIRGTSQEASRLAATGSAAVTFSGTEHVQTEISFTAAATDIERRLIEGTALPYGRSHIARKNGRKYRFQQGSIVWPDPRYVPVLIDHTQSASVGHYAYINDTPDGTMVGAKISAGPTGDQALAWASPEESVRTGFSVGVDFEHEQCVPDPLNPGVWLVPVGAAIGKEISLVAVPAFQGARVASVTLSADTEGVTMPAPASTDTMPGTGPDTTTADQTAAQQQLPNLAGQTFTADQMTAVMAAFVNAQPQSVDLSGPGPQFVDPTKNLPPSEVPKIKTEVREAAPYRFDYEGNLTPGPQYDLSADLVKAARWHDQEAHGRVIGFMQEMMRGGAYGMRRHEFDVDRADVATLNPTRQRPDLYVDQKDYRYPLYQSTNRGTLADSTPFQLPKFSSASGLVGAHTEGVEPTSGTFVATSQTITPTAKSGALDMTREAWDQGGNPQASALIWRQFNRSWYEALEAAVATFLNTLTAATDIPLGAGPTDAALVDAWDNAVARLLFVRGGDRFDMFAVEQELFVAFATATATDGRRFYPMINPSNATGSAGRRFRTLDVSGFEAVPAWALPSTAGSSNNSWLFDSDTVHTWDTGPQRFEFAGMTAAGAYAPVAMIRLAVWGYQALANTDITGVRQVTYDTTT
jgi:hypothetical protein